VAALAVDAEFGFRGGAEVESAFVPVVFCAVDTITGERHPFWGRDPDLAPFIDAHRGDLFIAHNLIAEAKYLLRLGITPPARWFDTMLARRYDSNAEVVKDYGLLDTLVKMGEPYGYADEKEDLAKRIGRLEFDPDDPAERQLIVSYCFEDCVAAALLHRRLAGRVPGEWMRCAAEFSLALARMEMRGIAIDMPRYRRLLERRKEVVERVMSDVNATYPVFPNSKWSRRRFLAWCAANKVAWPVTVSPSTGKKCHSFDKDTFRRMKHRHPFIEKVYQARKTVTQLNDRKGLIVDPGNGRHYFTNIPFGANSGRNTFKGFLLSAPKWMRFLIVPTDGHVLVSADVVAEEIMIAAHLSGDANMTSGYDSGDPHWAFAVRAGMVRPEATERERKAARAKAKSANFGVGYGQSARGLSDSKGIPFLEAVTLIRKHQQAHPDYWAWRKRYVTGAFRRGVCWTAGGWPRRVSRKDNPLSVMNFPVQGSGGDLLRLLVIYLNRQGVRLLATNHDSVLMECRPDQLGDLKAAVDFAFRQAVEQLFPGAPMRIDTKVYKGRYEEENENAMALWELVSQVLDGAGGEGRPSTGERVG
jgi:DNA polymerase I-like protein with 3'-5' exonuclease and polymerase domains